MGPMRGRSWRRLISADKRRLSLPNFNFSKFATCLPRLRVHPRPAHLHAFLRCEGSRSYLSIAVYECGHLTILPNQQKV